MLRNDIISINKPRVRPPRPSFTWFTRKDDATLLPPRGGKVTILCSHPLPCYLGRIRDPPTLGLLLVEMDQGLWGLTSESKLSNEGGGGQTSVASFKGPAIANHNLPSTSPGDEGSEGLVEVSCDETKITRTKESKAATCNAPIDEAEVRPSTIFEAWPPLLSVTERYAHHTLCRGRREVICLTDSGALHTYRYDLGGGEARKVGSWKVKLHANGATATCMCLLPKTPAFVEAPLARLVTSRACVTEEPGPSRGEGGQERCKKANQSPCGRGGSGGMGGCKKKDQQRGEETEQVVAIGTSHGGIILVEAIIAGTVSRDPTLRYPRAETKAC